MKMLVVGKFQTDGFALHIAETLTSMKNNVYRFEPGVAAPKKINKFWHRIDQVRRVVYEATDEVPKIRAKRIQPLFDLTKQQKPEIIIVCHDFLSPNEVGTLKTISPNCKIAMWFPDALVNFRKSYFMNAPYDGLFFKDPFIIYALNNVLQSKVYYMPECFNPLRHSFEDEKNIEEEYRCDITTAGNLHSWRVAFYQHLSNYNVKLWGPPAPLWMPKTTISQMHQNKLVHNNEKAKAFLGAKIVLNNLHYGEVWGLNVRTFEAAGIGAFQMVDWRPGLEQLFIDGEEIISFRSITDAKQKIDYWLQDKNTEKRQQIAQAGKRRALREHTYQCRLQLILDTLYHKEQGFPVPEFYTSSK